MRIVAVLCVVLFFASAALAVGSTKVDRRNFWFCDSAMDGCDERIYSTPKKGGLWFTPLSNLLQSSRDSDFDIPSNSTRFESQLGWISSSSEMNISAFTQSIYREQAPVSHFLRSIPVGPTDVSRDGQKVAMLVKTSRELDYFDQVEFVSSFDDTGSVYGSFALPNPDSIEVTSLRFSDDGSHLVAAYTYERDVDSIKIAGSSGILIVKAVGNNPKAQVIDRYVSPGTIYAAFSPSGQKILAATKSRLRVFDREGNHIGVRYLSDEDTLVSEPAFSKDEQRLVFVSKQGDVRHIRNWRIVPIDEPRLIRRAYCPIHSAIFLGDNSEEILLSTADNKYYRVPADLGEFEVCPSE